MSGVRRYRSRSEAETVRLAAAVVAELGAGGATLLLYGELGAGKTAFVRGVVAAVGGPVEEVSSPTFVLMQEYAGGARTVHHVDLYRLGAPDVIDLEPQLVELMSTDALVVIEWADRLQTTFADAVRIRIDDDGADDRTMTVEVPRPG